MIPLADLHVHLLAGLDDGPRTLDDAVQMCRVAYDEGARFMAATAHQNEQYPDVSPDRIRAATQQLSKDLLHAGIPLTVYPNAEVMAHPEMVASWHAGQLLSVADRGQYLLIEMPHGLFIDLRAIVRQLRAAGVRPILAHPERLPELLHERGLIEQFIQVGCLVQVSAKSLTHPANSRDAQALRDWVKRGIVHLLGSDGHSVHRRPPRMADAYQVIARWAGAAAADRIGSTNGMAVLQGLPLRVPAPASRRRFWFARFW